MEGAGNQIFISPSLEEVDNTIQKMEKDLGVPSADLGRGKGKQTTKKTPWVQKDFKSTENISKCRPGIR